MFLKFSDEVKSEEEEESEEPPKIESEEDSDSDFESLKEEENEVSALRRNIFFLCFNFEKLFKVFRILRCLRIANLFFFISCLLN